MLDPPDTVDYARPSSSHFAQQRVTPAASPGRRRWLIVGTAVSLLALAALVAAISIRVRTRHGDIELTIHVAGAEVFVDDEKKISLKPEDVAKPFTISLAEGQRELEIKTPEGVTIFSRQVTVPDEESHEVSPACVVLRYQTHST